MKLNYDYIRNLEEIYKSFKKQDYDNLRDLVNDLIKEDEKLSYNTLYNFIIKIYYESTDERQNLEGFITYLKDINLEDKQYHFEKFIDYFNLEISRFIEKDKVKEHENKLKSLNDDIEKLHEKSKKINEELKNSKFDIIGIIAGVLSIFTVFGLNFNFFKDLLLQNEKSFLFYG